MLAVLFLELSSFSSLLFFRRCRSAVKRKFCQNENLLRRAFKVLLLLLIILWLLPFYLPVFLLFDFFWFFLLVEWCENVCRIWEMSCFQLKVESLIIAIFNNKPYISKPYSTDVQCYYIYKKTFCLNSDFVLLSTRCRNWN